MIRGWTDLRAVIGRALLAQDCVLCAAASGDELVCPGCAADLPRLADACPQCAGPSPAGAVCGACLTRPPHFDATIAAWRYEFPVDRLVLALKYGQRLALAEAFGTALAGLVGERRVDALVPVPLGRARLAERGFNQSLEIARHVARQTGLELASGLAHACATRCRRPTCHTLSAPRTSVVRSSVRRRSQDARWRWSTT